MRLKKGRHSLTRYAFYSLGLHLLMLVISTVSIFGGKKETNLMMDIEIAGEGEFREATENARTLTVPTEESVQQSLDTPTNEKLEEKIEEKPIPEIHELIEEQQEQQNEGAQEPDLSQLQEQEAKEQEANNIPQEKVEEPAENNNDNQETSAENSQDNQEEQKEQESQEKTEEKSEEKTEEEAVPQEKTEEKEEQQKEEKKEKPKKKKKRDRKALLDVIKKAEKIEKKKNRRKKLQDIANQEERRKKSNADFDKLLTDTRDYSNEGQVRGSGRGKKGYGAGAFGKGKGIAEGDYEMISSQIYPHWVVPSGVRDAENIIIEIKIELGDNGEVVPSSIKIVDEKRYANDYVFRAAADSARRAILEASPLSIPREKLELFKEITLRFNLKEALGE